MSISGGGVYALYYTGDHSRYAAIRSPEAKMPIYVGSALDLSRRLWKHCQSLDKAWDLERTDFLCKFRVLVPDKGWHLWLEQCYINHKEPWWNRQEFSGFGTEGGRGVDGTASKWDLLHPGREAALGRKRPDAQQIAQIERQAKKVEVDSLQPTVLEMFAVEKD